MAAEMTRKILSSEWIPEPARRRPPPPPKPAFVPGMVQCLGVVSDVED